MVTKAVECAINMPERAVTTASLCSVHNIGGWALSGYQLPNLSHSGPSTM